jgi:hypothetical protein
MGATPGVVGRGGAQGGGGLVETIMMGCIGGLVVKAGNRLAAVGTVAEPGGTN